MASHQPDTDPSPLNTPQELAEPCDPGYWLLKQLNRIANPDWWLAFRCIANIPGTKKGKNTTEVKKIIPVQIKNLRNEWPLIKSEVIALNAAPQNPANIYFTINARPTETANKKEDIPEANCLYVDMDVTPQYTDTIRQAQLGFLFNCGLGPSILISSGHGYQLYYLLKKPIIAKTAEEIMKDIIEKLDCEKGGHVQDVTRIFRLPGTLNVKLWADGDTPPCQIVFPRDWDAQEPTFIYDETDFQNWPNIKKRDLSFYDKFISRMNSDPTQGTLSPRDKCRIAIEERNKHTNKEMMEVFPELDEETRNAEEHAVEIDGEIEDGVRQSLTKDFITLDKIKWPENHKWCKKYILDGYDSFSEDEKKLISEKNKMSDTSASTFDYRVMLYFVRQGYSFKAIETLWVNQNYKLFRPDKIDKSPDYIERTFERAIKGAAFIKKKIDDETEEEASVISEDPDEAVTMISRPRGLGILLTGIITLKQKITYEKEECQKETEDEEERLFLAITTKRKTAKKEKEKVVDGTIFNNVTKFRDSLCNDDLCCMARNVEELHFFKSHLLENPNIAKHSRPKNIRYMKGEFYFPFYRVSKDAIIQEDPAFTTVVLAKNPYATNLSNKITDPNQVGCILKHADALMYKIHMPVLPISVIGLIVSTAFKSILLEKGDETLNIPCLNIRGDSHTGKTETTKHIMGLAGYKPNFKTLDLSSTAIGICLTCNSIKQGPVVIDELKESDEISRNQIQGVKRMLRSVFNDQQRVTGTKEPGAMAIYNITTPLIVIGQFDLESEGDTAEQSRLIPITTGTFKIDDKNLAQKELFNEFKQIPLDSIAPYLYKFILNYPVEKFIQIKKELSATIDRLIKNYYPDASCRTAENYGTIAAGHKIWTEFLESYGVSTENTPDVIGALLENARNYIEDSGGTINPVEEKGQIDVQTELPNRYTVYIQRLLEAYKYFHNEISKRENNGEIFIKPKNFEESNEDTLYMKIEQLHPYYARYMAIAYQKSPIEAPRSLLRDLKKKNLPWVKGIKERVYFRDAQRKIIERSRYSFFDLKSLKQRGVIDDTQADEHGNQPHDHQENTAANDLFELPPL